MARIDNNTNTKNTDATIGNTCVYLKNKENAIYYFLCFEKSAFLISPVSRKALCKS